MKRIIYLLLLVIVTSSCASKLKQQVKAHNYFNKYPEELAEICGTRYPPEVKHVAGEPIFTPGETVIERDTVTVTVDCPDGSQVTADCPPNERITKTDTISTTDTIYLANTALITKLNYDLSKSNAELSVALYESEKKDKIIKKRNFQLGAFAVLVVLALLVRVYFYLKLKK